MAEILLQLFLYLNIFLIGALTTVAIQHAVAHFRPKPKPEPKPMPPVNIQIPTDMKDRLLKESQANFQAALDQSAENLQHDLDATSEKVNRLLAQLGTQVVGTEMERYRIDLVALRKQTETAFSGAQSEIGVHQAKLIEALKISLNEEMSAEKQRLLKQIDTKLGDAVASFLVETLQHDVDLGAQTKYLMETLEEHKQDFLQEVQSDAPAAE